MKKIIIIIVTLILIKPVLPVLDYAINYDYISTKLCKNIDKPKLKCNGKCHLAKELAKASEDEKPLNSDKKQIFKFEIEVLFCESFLNYNTRTFFNFEKKDITSFYQNLYFSEITTSIFHPPTFSC